MVGTLFTTKGKSVRSEDVTFVARDGAELEARIHIPPAVKTQSVPVVLYCTLTSPSAHAWHAAERL